ncbi:MAG: hypothetical protein RJB38_1210 [Pseudomonadota bacterium]|jgi:hypothetical protein
MIMRMGAQAPRLVGIAVLMGLASAAFAEEPSVSSPGGMGDSELKTEAARMSLAPHVLAMETSLMGALDQVRALKAQVKVAQNQPNSEFMTQYRAHTRDFQGALKTARSHEGDLKTRAGKFPKVAQTEEYRQVAPAMSNVERLSEQWEKQTTSTGYWRDNTRVTADLDQLERRLSQALDKTRGLSSRIDAGTVG